MESRTTDYNRFRDKVKNANFQIIYWGWHADYPDPENFMFLLYGPNSKALQDGENAANYDNPEFNRLFEKMKNMENSPERLEIIREMNRLLQRDAPWVFVYHPVRFGLSHQWLKNNKPTSTGYNTLKYLRIDGGQRAESRQEWNQPILWPLMGMCCTSHFRDSSCNHHNLEARTRHTVDLSLFLRIKRRLRQIINKCSPILSVEPFMPFQF